MQDKSKGLFRKVALDRLSSPEQLDRLMQVTNPRGWIALLALIGLLALGIGWSILGKVPTNIEVQGVLAPPQSAPPEAVVVTAEQPGILTEVLVAPDEFVGEGQPLATIASPQGALMTVTSPATGQIVEIALQVDEPAEPGAQLFTIQPVAETTGDELEAVIYVSLFDAEQIRPGMKVQVSPVTVPRQEFGLMVGKVKSVGEFPATDDMARALAPDDQPVIEVRVELERNENTPTGYEWTLDDGPDELPRANTVAIAIVTVKEERPIVRLFPILGFWGRN